MKAAPLEKIPCGHDNISLSASAAADVFFILTMPP